MIETAKERYAEIAGVQRRDAGYALSLRRLGGDQARITALFTDRAVRESEWKLIASAIAFGKGGIFHFWNELEPQGKRRFLEQLQTIDLEAAELLHQRFIVRGVAGAKVKVSQKNIGAPKVFDLTRGDAALHSNAREIGEGAFRRGEVAVLELS